MQAIRRDDPAGDQRPAFHPRQVRRDVVEDVRRRVSRAERQPHRHRSLRPSGREVRPLAQPVEQAEGRIVEHGQDVADLPRGPELEVASRRAGAGVVDGEGGAPDVDATRFRVVAGLRPERGDRASVEPQGQAVAVELRRAGRVLGQRHVAHVAEPRRLDAEARRDLRRTPRFEPDEAPGSRGGAVQHVLREPVPGAGHQVARPERGEIAHCHPRHREREAARDAFGRKGQPPRGARRAGRTGDHRLPKMQRQRALRDPRLERAADEVHPTLEKAFGVEHRLAEAQLHLHRPRQPVLEQDLARCRKRRLVRGPGDLPQADPARTGLPVEGQHRAVEREPRPVRGGEVRDLDPPGERPGVARPGNAHRGGGVHLAPNQRQGGDARQRRGQFAQRQARQRDPRLRPARGLLRIAIQHRPHAGDAPPQTQGGGERYPDRVPVPAPFQMTVLDVLRQPGDRVLESDPHVVDVDIRQAGQDRCGKRGVERLQRLRPAPRQVAAALPERQREAPLRVTRHVERQPLHRDLPRPHHAAQERATVQRDPSFGKRHDRPVGLPQRRVQEAEAKRLGVEVVDHPNLTQHYAERREVAPEPILHPRDDPLRQRDRILRQPDGRADEQPQHGEDQVETGPQDATAATARPGGPVGRLRWVV